MRKLSNEVAHQLSRTDQELHVIVEELQEGLADTGTVVHCSTVHKQDPHWRSHQKQKFPVTSSQKSMPEVCKATSG